MQDQLSPDWSLLGKLAPFHLNVESYSLCTHVYHIFSVISISLCLAELYTALGDTASHVDLQHLREIHGLALPTIADPAKAAV